MPCKTLMLLKGNKPFAGLKKVAFSEGSLNTLLPKVYYSRLTRNIHFYVTFSKLAVVTHYIHLLATHTML